MAQDEFNHAYCAMLHLLEQAFGGNAEILAAAIGAMYGLKARASNTFRPIVGVDDVPGTVLQVETLRTGGDVVVHVEFVTYTDRGSGSATARHG
jgi:hypothetical protein